MAVALYDGMVVDTPVKLTDRIRVSVPDLYVATRMTYGPMAFDPIVSGQGGTRLPQAGDRAVIGIDDGVGEPWLVSWHRDDTTLPPYSESGGGGEGGVDSDAVHFNNSSQTGSFLSVTTVDSPGISLESDGGDISLYAPGHSVDIGGDGANVVAHGDGGIILESRGEGDIVMQLNTSGAAFDIFHLQTTAGGSNTIWNHDGVLNIGAGGSGGIEVFEEPDAPIPDPPVGSIWIDTDEPAPGAFDSGAFAFFNG